MKRTKVKSNNIISIGYDVKTKELEIEFITSGAYKYFEVPREVYFQFLKAPSIGKFCWSNIRGRYRYEKI